MRTLRYKNYTITVSATRVGIIGKYAPTIQLAWQGDGKDDTRSFTLPGRYLTADEASEHALREATEWADRWLVHVGP